MNQQTIAKLKEIQTIDHKINLLNRQCAEKSGSLNDKHEHIQRLTQIIADKKDKAKKFKVEVDKKDLDLKCNEEKIAKLGVQLNTVRTNKEYSLLTGEIKSYKADNDRIEDELLNLFNQFDAIQKEITDLEAKLIDKKKELESAAGKVAEEINELKRGIEDAQVNRHKSLELVDSETLRRYEKIVQSKPDNTALACVIKAFDNINEYRCGCCHMDIPPQQVVELKRNKQDSNVVCCKSCMRILYVDEIQP